MEKKPILLRKYNELDRPTCNYEIKFRSRTNKFALNLSNIHIIHDKCKHCYLCKRFGKKYQQYHENKESQVNTNTDIGNCSVCWKISHTDFILKKIAENLAKEYYDSIINNDELTYYKMELENFFHSWLYK